MKLFHMFIDSNERLVLISEIGGIMEDRNILLKWFPYKEKIETIGHQMPDGWWYVRLPFDMAWHFVPDSDVECQ